MTSTLETHGLTILWRGSLASCNYGCPYCPFAKTSDDRVALAADRQALERFEAWAIDRPYPVSILITPWGEGLIRRYYREAMTRLSHAPNVETIAIQTNLSCSVDWVAQCDLRSVAFWTTYHPGETPLAPFIRKIEKLESMGARYSVGVVGLNEHLDHIENLRAALPESSYLWINAYKRVENYYAPQIIERLVAIDPLFELNNRVWQTSGQPCRAGHSTISVIADGTARRCHFLQEAIGNIYDPDFEDCLQRRPCTAEICRCHIGYSHLEVLDFPSLFGRGILERSPDKPVTRTDALDRIARFETATTRTR